MGTGGKDIDQQQPHACQLAKSPDIIADDAHCDLLLTRSSAAGFG